MSPRRRLIPTSISLQKRTHLVLVDQERSPRVVCDDGIVSAVNSAGLAIDSQHTEMVFLGTLQHDFAVGVLMTTGIEQRLLMSARWRFDSQLGCLIMSARPPIALTH